MSYGCKVFSSNRRSLNGDLDAPVRTPEEPSGPSHPWVMQVTVSSKTVQVDSVSSLTIIIFLNLGMMTEKSKVALTLYGSCMALSIMSGYVTLRKDYKMVSNFLSLLIIIF